MTWITLTTLKRKQNSYHAVYLEASGGYWTYCGQFSRPGGVRDRMTADPPRRCGCCRARVLHRYLVPEELVEIARIAREAGSVAA